MKSIAIIPARMGSSRFPGKPMEKICGLPMIAHVYYRAKMSEICDYVYVATCDQEIFDYIESIGGNVVMTSSLHERASDRSAEALSIVELKEQESFDVVAMIQGDEPLVTPHSIDFALSELLNEDECEIVNLMCDIESMDEFNNPNAVKVVTAINNHALYFSREAIPSLWGGEKNIPMKKQTGLVFFKRDFLIKFNEMNPTPLEIVEAVDMMRVLEYGYKIKMVEMDGEHIGVDTPSDLIKAESMMKNDKVFTHYR